MPERAPNPAMSELERWLLLALSVLVARQRALVLGQPDPIAIPALFEPEQFPFEYQNGAHRCRFARERSARFQAAVLSLERQDFVAPISALAPQLRMRELADGAIEVKLLPGLVEALALGEGDPVRACYTPLQLLFDSASGFFDPQRESWHAFLGRALALRLPQGRCEALASGTRLHWDAGTLDLSDAAAGPHLAARVPGLAFELDLERTAFRLQLRSGEPGRGLFVDLHRLCGAAELPSGIAVDADGPHGLVIRGSV
ncbi:MAG: hypothetical protein LJE90_08675 [Betaproteobacteria bacterium]|nr:hypothetical protein [Betaproteobacteria bacterium]